MTVCSGESFKAADSLLARLLHHLHDKLDPTMAAQLDSAQASWAAYAPVECRLENASSQDGTVYSMLVTSCRRGLIEARIRQLAPLLCDFGTTSEPCPPADEYTSPFDEPPSKKD
jgi:uncharacterized protein YecT (DUF1311 family)